MCLDLKRQLPGVYQELYLTSCNLYHWASCCMSTWVKSSSHLIIENSTRMDPDESSSPSAAALYPKLVSLLPENWCDEVSRAIPCNPFRCFTLFVTAFYLLSNPNILYVDLSPSLLSCSHWMQRAVYPHGSF